MLIKSKTSNCLEYNLLMLPHKMLKATVSCQVRMTTSLARKHHFRIVIGVLTEQSLLIDNY